jgi:small GTP-binding protein
MPEQEYDKLLKIVIIGSSGTGKTALLSRYVDNEFSSNHIATIGVDFKIKTVDNKGKKIKLQLWDTAGQERFRSISQAYYRGAHYCIITFDLTSKESFQSLDYWIDEISKSKQQNKKYIIVGTKYDLLDDNFDRKFILNYCEINNAKYIETSSKNNYNINYIFDYIIDDLEKNNDIYNITEPKKQNKNYKIINKIEEEKKESKCCS